MKRCFLIYALFLSMVLITKTSFSQLLVEENFNYTLNSLLTANGYNAHSGSGTLPIKVTGPALSYSGYPNTGVGNAITIDTTGEDVNKTFTSQTGGEVYVSFLATFSKATTTGDYFFHLGPTPIGTTFSGRIFARSDASGNLAFGVSKASATTIDYSAFNYSMNTTYLFVIRYRIVSGLTNDTVSLWINPVIGPTMPTPQLTCPDIGGTDPANIGVYAFRQGTGTTSPRLTLSNLRVGLSWNDMFPASLQVSAPTFNPVAGTYNTTQNITITSSTSGTDIYYTLNGTDPTTSSTLYTAPVAINGTATLKAIALKSGMTPSIISTGLYTIQVAAPVFNPSAGAYNTTQNITITSSTSGADIYYTLNGTDPTTSSTLYSTPVAISSTTTLKARAFKTGMDPSLVATAIYTIIPFAPSQIFKETMGTVAATTTIAAHNTALNFDNDQYIFSAGSIANPADIRATSASSGYTGASGLANVFFTGTSGEYGFAIENINASNYLDLKLSFAVRKENAAPTAFATMTLEFWNGTTWNQVTVNGLPQNTDGAQWYYIENVSLPVSAQINGLKIRFKKSGTIAMRLDDVLLSGTPGVAAPTFNPVAGAYFSPQNITITTSTSGADIYYSTNGTDPQKTSTLYTAPVVVSASTLIKARAFKTGMDSSQVTQGQYVICTTTATLSPNTTQTFCQGGSVSLDANTGVGLTYKWLKNSVIIAGETNSSLIVSQSGSYQVVVTEGLCEVTSSAIIVNVSPLPASPGTISGLTSVSKGQNGVVYTVPAISDATTYNWTLPTGASIVSGVNTNSITVNFSASAVSGNIIVTGVNACGNGPASSPLPISIQTSNQITLTIGSLVACNIGDSINIPINVSNFNNVGSISLTVKYNPAVLLGIGAINWYPGLTGIIEGVNNTTGTFKESWLYTTGAISVPDGPLCYLRFKYLGGNSAVTFSTVLGDNEITDISVNPYTIVLNSGQVNAGTTATATITPSGPTSFCIGDSVVLNANTGTGLGYQWKKDGNNITGETNNFYTAKTAGAYTVAVTTNCGTVISSATTITLNSIPAGASLITGANTVCKGQSAVMFSVPAVATATGYNWTLPSGATIASGANTNSITIDFSALATSGVITVAPTNICGTGAVSPNFNIHINEIPVAADVVSGAALVCSGQSGLTYSVAPIAGAISYLWSLPTGASIASGNNTNSITINFSLSAASGNISVKGTNMCGDGTSSPQFPITVSPLPNVTATSVSATTFCQGGSVIIDANTGSNLAYQWKKNSMSIVGATNSSYTATTTGTYSVVITNTLTNCFNESANVQVTVNSLPVVFAQASSLAVCSGNQVTLTGSGANTYVWNNSVVNGVNFTPTSTKKYTVTGTDLNQCSNTDSISVTVNPLPTISTSFSKNTICLGDSVLLTNTYTGSSPWNHIYSDGINVFNIQNIITSPATSWSKPIDTTIYSLISLTDGNGCANTISYSVTVNVNPLPAVGTNATATTLCSGASVILTGSGADTYIWSNGVINGQIFIPVATTTFTVTGTDNNQCSNQANVVIMVNPLPSITGTTPASRCGTGTVTLNASASAGTINWYDASIGGTILGTGTSYTTPSISTTTTYFVDATDLGCTSASRTAIDASVNTMAIITGTTPASRCGAGTIVLGATASAGTINWYATSTGGASLGSGSSFTTPFISSTTNYFVEAADLGCTTSSRTPITATVNAIPTIIGTTPSSRCGVGTLSLGATASSGIVNWYDTAIGGTSLGFGTSFTTPIISTTTTYYVDATELGCTTSSRTAVTATVNAIPTITGTTPASRCGAGTINLGATASAGSVNWYSAASGGISLGSGISFTTPNISATTTYYVDATELGCTTSSRTAIIAVVNDIPTITGTTPSSRCGAGTLNLGAIASTGNINWYDAALGGTSLGIGTSFTTPIISTTTAYYVDATELGCTTSSRTAIIAVVNDIPTITGTTPSSRCGAGTLNLGAIASTGNINWYDAALGGTSLGIGTSFTTPIISTTTAYYVDATELGCTTTSRTAVTATVNAIPTITGTTPASRCGAGTLNLGAIASAGNVNWYSAAIGGTSLGIGTSFTTPSISATTIYYVDATELGCTTTSRTAVTATVNAIPTITGTTPSSRCGAGTLNLGATASAGNINWYSAATGGTSLGIGTNFTTPSISTTTTYYVDATELGCTTASRTAVTATVNAIPTITGTTPASRCGTGTLNLGATASAGNINWYSATAGGTSLGIGTNFITPSISATTTYYVDATELGCTTTSRTAVTATVNSIPTITGTTPASRCGTGTLNLGATASAGNINWYAAATGGTSLGIGTNFITPSISATTTYYVDATELGCTTTSRTAVTATVNSIPTITGTTPASRCGAGTLNLGATASAGNINWYSAPTGGISLGIGTSFTTPSISTTTTYYVDATELGCTTTSRTAVTATVNAVPSITGTTPASRCGTGTLNLGATASAGNINWFAAATGGTSLGIGTSFTTPSISTTTTYYVDATNLGCTTPNRNPIMATVNPIPVVNLGNDTGFCHNLSLSLNAGSGFASYLWSNNANSQTILVDSLGFGIGVHSIWVKVTDANTCIGIDTINVTIKNCVGILNYSNLIQIKVFPNPSNGKFTVEINGMKESTSNICLTDITGKVIYCDKKLQVNSGRFLQEYDFAYLPKGTYIIKISNNDMVKIERLVIN